MSSKDLRTAYHPNYFSVESILAAQTLVPCTTQMRLPKFGFLVPDCNSEDLPVGTSFDLPIWAARVLCRPLRTFVTVTIPAGFKEVHREVIEEDANSSDLNKVNANFYESGHLCTSLFHNDAGELAEMLPEILQTRILCIGATTGTTLLHSSALKEDLMDTLEKKLLKDTQAGKTNLREWLETFNLPPAVEAELRRPKPQPPAPAPPPVQRQPAPHYQNLHQQQQHLPHHLQPQQHQHQQFTHRPVAHVNPQPTQPVPAPAHSHPQVQLPHSSYGNPYAHLQTGGLPPPYNNINVAPHHLGGGGAAGSPGISATHNINTQLQNQHQSHHMGLTHTQHQGLPHSHYPHHHGHQ
ncbi:unnamed protein product [Orchesella dallaii]|uniref:DNA replication complex GINS protein PSF3 n=1 Tax=Orchesella dallaii TaxID=48710 RepID=A0ABP1RR32_9HEXA